MIISHSKKFIFIHVFKAAGNNIRAELRDYNYTKSKKNYLLSIFGIYPKVFSSDYPGHMTAQSAKETLPQEIFNSYFKFAFVRNPWDWQVSLYHFMKQTNTHHQNHIIKNLSFEQYLDWRINEDIKYQKDFVYDKQEAQLVDFVGKVEYLQSDFDQICLKLNIPKRQLGVRNSSVHRPYQSYYTFKSRELVEEAFKDDIRLFGYKFDS